MTKFLIWIFTLCLAVITIFAIYAWIQVSGFTWWLIPLTVVIFLIGQALIEGIFKFME